MTAYLLDTNAAIALLNGDKPIQNLLTDADQVYLSAITLGELYFGAENSVQVSANVARVQSIETQYPLLFPDTTTARLYGQLRFQLKRKGRALSQNDVWIAAIAIHYQTLLMTRDNDFNAVDGLTVMSW